MLFSMEDPLFRTPWQQSVFQHPDEGMLLLWTRLTSWALFACLFPAFLSNLASEILFVMRGSLVPSAVASLTQWMFNRSWINWAKPSRSSRSRTHWASSHSWTMLSGRISHNRSSNNCTTWLLGQSVSLSWYRRISTMILRLTDMSILCLREMASSMPRTQ